jgi:hypothetical protein
MSVNLALVCVLSSTLQVVVFTPFTVPNIPIAAIIYTIIGGAIEDENDLLTAFLNAEPARIFSKDERGLVLIKWNSRVVTQSIFRSGRPSVHDKIKLLEKGYSIRSRKRGLFLLLTRI